MTRPRRHRKRTFFSLFGPGLVALCALAASSIAEERRISGIYRDGVLVDTFLGLEVLDEITILQHGSLRPEGIPPLPAETLRRNAACARCFRTLDTVAGRLKTIHSRGTGVTSDDRAELEVLLYQVRVAEERLDEIFAERGTKLRSRDVPSLILDRHRETARRFKRRIRELAAAVDDVIAERPNAVQRAAAVAERLPRLGRSGVKAVSPPEQMVIQLKDAPLLVRAEADALLQEDAGHEGALAMGGSGIPPPGPADLAQTPEIPFTPEITQKAADLGNSPVAIYEFVRNRSTFQPYRGSRKGAAETLRQLRGNDVDQASLLMALLRVSGVPCRYVRGTVELDAAAANAWLGVDDAAVAANILATAGLDGAGILGGGGKVVTVRFTHVWVEAHVPISNYRGFPVDQNGKSWLPLAPAFKRLDLRPGEDVLTAMAFDEEVFFNSYISSFNALTPVEQLEADVQVYLDANQPGKTVEDIKRAGPVFEQDLGLLPASLPFRLRTVSDRLAEIEDNQRFKIRFEIFDGPQNYIDHTFNLSDIAGRRLTLEYEGATQADRDLIALQGSILLTDPDLIQVKPVLKRDNVVVASSLPAAPGLAVLALIDADLHFIQPAGALNTVPLVENEIDAGISQAIVFDTFRDTWNTFIDSLNLPPETFYESLLHTTAREYLFQVNQSVEELERLVQVTSLEPVRPVMVSGVFDKTTPMSLDYLGMKLDADRRIMSTFAVDDEATRIPHYNRVAGMESSTLSGRVFEDSLGVDGLSALRVFQEAGAQGISICRITSSIAADCPGFDHPASVTATVNAILAAGNEVIIPESEVSVTASPSPPPPGGGAGSASRSGPLDWVGRAIVDLDPSTGAAQFTIGGERDGKKNKESTGQTITEVLDPTDCQITDVTATITDPTLNQCFFSDDPNPITITADITLSCGGGANQLFSYSVASTKTIEDLGSGNYLADFGEVGSGDSVPFKIVGLTFPAGTPTTLQGDIPVPVTISTDPPTPGIDIGPSITQDIVCPDTGDRSPTTIGLRVTGQGGSGDITTDASGNATFDVSSGHGGQGSYGLGLPGVAEADEPIFTVADKCTDCCGSTEVARYSGELWRSSNPMSIPGRGLDFDSAATFRSSKHLAAAGSGDFGNQWCLKGVDERVIEDMGNLTVVDAANRVDTFPKFGSDFKPPIENYKSIIEIPAGGSSPGDYMLRDRSGTFKFFRDTDDPDIPGRLIRQEDRNGNAMSFLYAQPPGLSKHVLTTAVDTLGRSIEYRYYPENDPNPGRRGRLKEIEDFRRDNSPTGRRVLYDYDAEGNLIRVTGPAVVGTPNSNDFPQGKTTRYRYITQADLPPGLSQGEQERLLGNLTHVWAPNEVGNNPGVDPPEALASEVYVYGMDPLDPLTFDRVVSHTIGGTNAGGVPAGGTFQFIYEQVSQDSPTPNDPFLRVTETDSRGNVEIKTYSAWDTLLEHRELTRGFRALEPAEYVTTCEYDKDKNLVRETLPEGNVRAFTYDQSNPDRFQQGNRTARLVTPDARGGDQASIATQTIYEPVFNQVAAVTDPRGLDLSFTPPTSDTAARTQEERYTTDFFFDYQEGSAAAVLPLLAAELNTTEAEVQSRLDAAAIQLGLGDLNGDGDTTARINGNVIRVVRPSVSLLAGSNQAGIEGDLVQDIVTQYRYNDYGQLTVEIDPEGNVHTRAYFPETDPDGDGTATPAPANGRTLDAITGGYISLTIRDDTHLAGANNNNGAAPTQISMSYTYDDVGNRTSITGGRGIRTDFTVNELNQVVRTTVAADVSGAASANPPEPSPLVAFAYLRETQYDFNENTVSLRIEDRGDTSNTGGFVDLTTDYDILDNPVQSMREVSVLETLVTRLRYDANENLVLKIMPEGNAVATIYDERDLLFQRTTGATAPTAEALGAPAGTYDPRGGTPSTVTYNYDLNRNRVEVVDAADTDLFAGNNSTIAGAGDVTITQYDGFDRRIAGTDPAGNIMRMTYDPNGNVVRTMVDGDPVEDGPGSGDNRTLAVTESIHDERSRVITTHRVLFETPDVTIVGSPALTDTAATDVLVPYLADADSDTAAIPSSTGISVSGRVSQVTEYDRDSRQTFTIQDDTDTYRVDYDGADRVIIEIDPEGNIVKYAYDDNNNRIEQEETDVSQVGGVASEIFVTTRFHDSLDRVEIIVDNIGQTIRHRYDSRNNRVATADAEGPLTGASISRRIFTGGALTVNTINDFGNVTLHSYDGINRRTSTERILTVTGQGDGTNIGADIFGVATTTPTPDTSQGGGDGIIQVNTDWDRNSLRETMTDDNGNRTSYTYDNLNRRLTETKGTVVAPALADRDDPDTTIAYGYDPDHNRVQFIDENGSVIVCTFDALNRETSCNITRGPGVVGTTELRFDYDGLSRRTRCTDNNNPGDSNDDSAVTFAFDSFGRIIEETQKIGTLSTKAVTQSWNAENLRVGLDHPNGRSVEYTFDKLDRINTVLDQGAGMDIADYDFIGAFRVLERRYPINGTRLTFLDNAGTTDVGHDGLRRHVQLRHLDSGNSIIVGFTHLYDRMNNKLNEEKLHLTDNSELYDYDSAYRLTGFERGTLNAMKDAIAAPTLLAGAVQAQDWTLDGTGNWTDTSTTVGGVPAVESRQHSSFNELIDRGGNALDHDQNGNEIDDGTATFEWDFRNRLKEVTRKSDGMQVAEFAYDALGRRIRKAVSNGGLPNDSDLNGTTDFYYDSWRVIEERNGSDALTQQYVYGNYIDEPLIMDQDLSGDGNAIGAADQRLFYLQNSLYSTFALTDVSGNIVEQYFYDPFGNPTFLDASGLPQTGAIRSAVDNPFLFTGRRFDPESDLYQYRYRNHSPVEGRFLSRDDIGIWTDGGSLGNGYAFVANNPIALVDPFGRNSECIECRLVVMHGKSGWLGFGHETTDQSLTGTTLPLGRLPVVTDDGKLESIILQARVRTDREPCCCYAEDPTKARSLRR